MTFVMPPLRPFGRVPAVVVLSDAHSGGVRAIRITLRTLHLIAFGALYGGHLYAVAAERLLPALAATIATGAALAALEIYRTRLWLVQVRGVVTMAKILLVATVPLAWELRVWVLTAAIVLGGVSAHMPGRLRYFSIVHGRVVGEQEKG